MTFILCLGSEEDAQLQHLTSALRDAGVHPLIINTAIYPGAVQVVCEPQADSFALILDNEVFEIDQFSSFFWQRYYPPAARSAVDNKNALSALSPLFYHRTERWFNPLTAIRFHQAKPVQVREAQALGARIPHTLISNDPHRLKQFCENHQNVILKPVFGGNYTARTTKDEVHTQTSASENHLPVTLQACIEGDDVRTFVIDNRVFAAVIYSDKPDYRTDDYAHAQAITIPAEMKSLCVAICLQFGMKWCAIDWRRNSKGEFVFLEANPAPMFCRFEAETGLPLTETLVQALLSTE